MDWFSLPSLPVSISLSQAILIGRQEAVLVKKVIFQAIQIERGNTPVCVLDSHPFEVNDLDDAKARVRELFQMSRFPLWEGPPIEAVRVVDDGGIELHRWDDLAEFLKKQDESKNAPRT
jgi:hypothetical protein